jgi:stage III sporulation protein AG
MESVGHVKVMITLKASEELVVEKEEPVSRSSTNETDSQGGTRIVNQVETEETTVYRTDGTTSEPYVVKTLSPEIEGVVVVAEGAGDGNVDKTVTEIAEALFGVEAHKVKVVRMEQKTGGNG